MSESTTRLPRMAVIGGGTFGLMHLRAYKQLERDGRARLVALADLDEDVLARHRQAFGVACYTDYQKMLREEQIDAVGIVTPDHLHRSIALDCIEAGKHVLVEKPLDVTVEGCREIAAAAHSAEVVLEVDFHKRFDPYHIRIKQMVDEGKCGTVQYGYAHMEDRIEVPRDWFPSWAPGSSPAWFLGVHMYDLVRWVVSGNAARVYATGVRGRLASLGIDTFDSIQAKVSFDNDAHFTFDTSWILPDEFEAIVNQGFRLVGSKGVIECDSQDRNTMSCFAGEGMASYNLGFFRETHDKDGAVRFSGYGIASIADFVENVAFVLNGGELSAIAGSYASGDDGIAVTQIACAVHESIETGRVVEI